MFDEDGICGTCKHMVTLRDGDRVLVACVRGHDVDGDDGARIVASVPMECDDYVDFEAPDTQAVVTQDTSDGYHTFAELYVHRAVLFSVIVRDHQDMAWKSMLHHDGTMYDGMFIVGIDTPLGQATYHYDFDTCWDMFDCKVLYRAPEWDGHTPDEAIRRISTLGPETCHYEFTSNVHMGGVSLDCCGLRCDSCGHEQMSMNAPTFCPGCGKRVMR